jgi:NAD(P)-dependent dehydrogenase (short-subunit alcohol dehydrogenase family)
MDGRCGIVTAAGSGMGRAGALLLAREGAAVCVVDRDGAAVEALVDEIAAAGGRAFAIEADLRSPDASRSLVKQTEEALGPIDFLWNMSAIPVLRRSRTSTSATGAPRSTSI